MKKFLLSLMLVLTVLSSTAAFAKDNVVSPSVTPNTEPPKHTDVSPKTADVSVLALAGTGAACAAVAVYCATKARHA